jgi:hypothetical protein
MENLNMNTITDKDKHESDLRKYWEEIEIICDSEECEFNKYLEEILADAK